jgi:hypothetical protein
MNLTAEEHGMLKQAAAAGVPFSISGRPPAEMQHAANVASALRSKGLVVARIHNSSREADRRVDRVLVELTDEGRRYLAEQE